MGPIFDRTDQFLSNNTVSEYIPEKDPKVINNGRTFMGEILKYSL